MLAGFLGTTDRVVTVEPNDFIIAHWLYNDEFVSPGKPMYSYEHVAIADW